MTVGDSDGETDVVVETEEVCDGDGPLDVTLAVVDRVKEVEGLDVTDGERDRDLLFLVRVGRNV